MNYDLLELTAKSIKTINVADFRLIRKLHQDKVLPIIQRYLKPECVRTLEII